MMSDISLLKTKKDHLIDEARAVLKEAIECGFETVLIIGIKGDKVSFKASPCMEVTHKLGMIELAKMDWIRKWGGSEYE